MDPITSAEQFKLYPVHCWFRKGNEETTITMSKSNKTLWQKVYSFFGFWTYTIVTHMDDEVVEKRIVLYWCFLPLFKFYRKFDLFTWRVK